MSNRKSYTIKFKTAEEAERERQLKSWLRIPRGDARTEQYHEDIRLFAERLRTLSSKIGFTISSRGWCYQLEGLGLITKDQFDETQDVVNRCRKWGLLPVDFVADDASRSFSGVETPEDKSTQEWIKELLEGILDCHYSYTPDWWKGEEYYIQMLVEKIDLKTLFSPVCRIFKIPIATSKGWSSILQRATYAKRFKQAEEKGLKCVLLYCGDHDPEGLQISEKLRTNLSELKKITWSDDDNTKGYDPKDLIIDRFGLNYDFIEDNNLSWIDNLITASGKNLADPSHSFYKRDYIQEYLEKYGERKCEANAIVVRPDQARLLCLQAIENYLGDYKEVIERFQAKREELKKDFDNLRQELKIENPLKDAIEKLEESIA